MQAWKIKFSNDCFWSVPDWSTFLYHCNFARGTKILDLSSKFLAWRFNCDDIKIMFVCIHLYVFKINSYACQISLTLPYDTFWKFINLFSWLQKGFSQQLPLKPPNYQRECYDLSKKIHDTKVKVARKIHPFYLFQTSVTFHINNSHFFCSVKPLTGLLMSGFFGLVSMIWIIFSGRHNVGLWNTKNCRLNLWRIKKLSLARCFARANLLGCLKTIISL